MEKTILVAGGTGDLGGRIIKALIDRGAEVRAIVRHSSDQSKVDELVKQNVKVIPLDMSDTAALAEACKGVSCVVSALAGLRDVIVDSQCLLLDAAVAAGVPHFIPSDFSSDFTKLTEGENRNFDLRRAFHRYLDKAPIAVTSIFIGAFADILFYNTPLFNLKENSVSYWGGNPDWKVDFTTKDNTAAYTAAAALDPEAPRALHIASFQITPTELSAMGSEMKKVPFKLTDMGTVEELAAYNKKERAAHPEGEEQLYPKWQSSQYLQSMFSVQNDETDNERYPGIRWTAASEVLSGIKKDQ